MVTDSMAALSLLVCLEELDGCSMLQGLCFAHLLRIQELNGPRYSSVLWRGAICRY